MPERFSYFLLLFFQCRKKVERINKNHIVNNLIEAYLKEHPGKHLLLEYYMSGSKNFQNSCPPIISYLSYSETKKDDPLALTKFLILRMSGQMDSLDPACTFSCVAQLVV